MTTLDLNADLGEGSPADAALLTLVSSASIACGGHAGTAETMRAALRLAAEHGVVAGAHPGFADPEHFGRRRLDLTTQDLTGQITRQLESLQRLADAEAVTLRYVKLHGALANMAAEDEELAGKVFELVKQHDRRLAILALDNSAQVVAAELLKLTVIREAYADRAYLANGMLLPRDRPGAVQHDVAAMTARAERLALQGEIVAADGKVLKTGARSLCLHGDTPDAVEAARAIRQALQAAGIGVAAAL